MYTGKHRITYYDLDAAGRVKLSALLRMVHIAADINANELGIGFHALSQYSMSFVLQRFALSVMREPTYDEEVTIRTWPDSVARGTFLRKGDMHDGGGKKIMEWTSMWILLDLAERKILRPSALPVELPDFENYGVEIMPVKIALPNTELPKANQYVHTVRYADIDTNNHMNNSVYADLITNALGATGAWREVQINYLAETRLGEEIVVTTVYEGETATVTGTVGERTTFAAVVKGCSQDFL
ncbi:MAG: thioesterase [Defluviitaleaceae bacterium]|nr:thioesterase [Defluviitaleaceae bacterium]